MKFVADLHIHSHYSRATSKNLTFEHLAKWAQLKGVQVVGTGDIAHPGWLQEMKDKLQPAEEGLFRLKDDIAQAVQTEVATACQSPVRFMLAGEISNIYKRGGKVRKIHNVIFAPTLEAVEKIQVELEKIGNIRSDGRPILGLDSRDLLEIILDIDERNYLIPAHIWTPWFAMLGSKSGFDSVEECFDDLTPHIFALETGLSSDPPMNWRISNLDGYTLVSNSDAHSPQKLAREANLFDTALSYDDIFAALKSGDPDAFLGTVEFFPEEGKYHHDGHRKCGISWTPRTTIEHDGVCPVCHKPVTVGVLSRVESLADRPEGEKPTQTHPFHSLIPLPEVLSELLGVGSGSKRVKREHERLLAELGAELAILQEIPLAEIKSVGGERLAEGIRRMREGEVQPIAGYDGEYGIIKLFDEPESKSLTQQMAFFGTATERSAETASPPLPTLAETTTVYQTEATPSPSSQSIATRNTQPSQPEPPSTASALLSGLNAQQRAAAQCITAPLVIVAGPGTGKTRTLTYRLAYLIAEQDVPPEQTLAITFTNKAAEEMSVRLTELLGSAVVKRMTIKTFHAFGAMLLRQSAETANLSPNFAIASEETCRRLLKQGQPDLKEAELSATLSQISEFKNHLWQPDSPELADPDMADMYRQYEQVKRQSNLLDFDDLILQTVALFEEQPAVLQACHDRFRWISVDEYQDINYAQYRLLRRLTAPQSNLCVIGDPDQAIYGFRGAKREYFLTFQQDYPDAQRMQLNQNYRSTQLILDASRQVIAKGKESQAAELWSEVINSVKVDFYTAPTDKAEAEYVVHQMERMLGGTSYFSLDSGRVDDEAGGYGFGDFAVLYRLGAQVGPLVEAIERSGMPYQVIGQRSLYEHQEVKTILAYLWWLHTPQSIVHVEQLLGFLPPEGLLRLPPTAWENLMIKPTHQKWLRQVGPFLAELGKQGDSESVVELIGRVHRFLLEHGNYPTSEASAERLQKLIQRARPFAHDLTAFLEATALQKESDFYDPRADRVTLMTLHASKGLEFPVVFMVGCETGLLPYLRADEPTDVEEERRLFYVGMTRAQQKLILTQAKSRFLFGQRLENEPSAFVGDIEAALKEIKKTAARPKSKSAKPDTGQQLSLF